MCSFLSGGTQDACDGHTAIRRDNDDKGLRPGSPMFVTPMKQDRSSIADESLSRPRTEFWRKMGFRRKNDDEAESENSDPDAGNWMM